MSIVVEEEQFNLEEGETLDNLTEEVTEEAFSESDVLEAEVTDTLPEKFKGKSVEDIAKSYAELEKERGRQANELGELRKLTDDILKQQLDAPAEKKESNIDLDDLLENPNDVITKAMDDNPRIAALEKELQDAKVEKNKLGFEDRHKDWKEVLSSSDFQSWVTGSPVRHNMFMKANDAFDYATLDEVFNLYGELRGAAKEKAENTATTKRKKQLRNISVEKGSTGEVTKKVYRRADLIRLKQTNPTRYNDMQEDIMLAYTEGRVR